MLKHSRLIILFCIVNFAATLPAQNAVLTEINSISVENMYRIDNNLYRSGQPDEKGFEALESFGIKEILNLRHYHDDADLYKKPNMKLYRVKMDAHDIEDSDIIKALTIIKNRKGPMLIHCKHGSDRTGVVCAMYRIVFQSWSKEKALAELRDERLGYHSIFFNIPNYIREVNVEKIKKAVGI